jgi:hypothetical protein
VKVGDLVRHKQLGYVGIIIKEIPGTDQRKVVHWVVFRHGIRVRWWVEDMEVISGCR